MSKPYSMSTNAGTWFLDVISVVVYKYIITKKYISLFATLYCNAICIIKLFAVFNKLEHKRVHTVPTCSQPFITVETMALH